MKKPQSNAELEKKYNSVYKGDSAKFYTYNSFPESKLIIDMLERWNDMRVLEIGCGEGRLAAMLSFAGAAQVDAIDYSEEAINIAKQNISLDNVAYDCRNYQEIDEKYDVVVLQGVLEHLDQPFIDLQQIFERNVAEQGVLITSSPSFLNPRGYIWMTLQLLFDVPMSLTDLHFLCPFDFMEFADNHGYMLEYRSTDHDWGAGERTLIDMKKRLTNALRDAGMANDKVDRLLLWLAKAVKFYEPQEYSGTTVAYKLFRP